MKKQINANYPERMKVGQLIMDIFGFKQKFFLLKKSTFI
jgi:hypothetical protein